MKILYLVRHAKSSWNNSNIFALARHLNDRGNGMGLASKPMALWQNPDADMDQ